MFQLKQNNKSGSLYRKFMIGAVLLAVGLALAFPPKRIKGPSLIHLGGGHGITVSDMVALVPLTLAVALIGFVLWTLRTQLRQRMGNLLSAGGAEIFLFGLSAGILLNGAVTTLDWRSGDFLTWLGVAGLFGMALLFSPRKPS